MGLKSIDPRVLIVTVWALTWANSLMADEALSTRLLEFEDEPTQHIELKWQGTIRAEAGRPGSWIEGFVEDRFNVTFDPSFIVYFSYPRVLPLRLLTGNVPDVTWIYGRDTPRFARHGFAMELPYEVILKHAPNYVRLLNEHAPNNWLLTFADGKNYGLPLFTTEAREPWASFWRMDWLHNVGIDRAPETLEEMEEALRRFRYNDPDGNGIQDTWGMCPWKPPSLPDTMDRSFEEVFAAHGVLVTAWMQRGDKVVWGGTLPETKAALTLLRRWYAEGLIYPDYMTLPRGSIDLIKTFTGGKVGYLYSLGVYHNFDPDFTPGISYRMKVLFDGGEIVPGGFPSGPGGQGGGGVPSERLSALMFGSHLADEPEKVIRVLRMMDEMAADEDLFLAARLGKRGLHWEWDSTEGLYSIPPYNTRYHASRELIHLIPEPWMSWGYYAPFGASRELSNRYRTKEHREFNAEFRAPKFAFEDVLMSSSIVPSADKFLADLVQMQTTMFTEIIIGRRPIEDFDLYRQQWYDGGGAVLTAEANVIFAQKAAILKAGGVPALEGDSEGQP